MNRVVDLLTLAGMLLIVIGLAITEPCPIGGGLTALGGLVLLVAAFTLHGDDVDRRRRAKQP